MLCLFLSVQRVSIHMKQGIELIVNMHFSVYKENTFKEISKLYA